jgi:carbonic anhydrase/acetyltransferase-like protein (isoleucine patch superfamily)
MREPSHPTVVGDEVTVGHGVILHGCTVADRCLIGMGAILLNGSSVGADCIVAAGTLLPEGMAVPPRSLVIGSPGKVRRSLREDEVRFIRESAANYVAYRLDYMGQA